jgi:multidrug efflux pump subunit AcrA (membrane-fusion protein)
VLSLAAALAACNRNPPALPPAPPQAVTTITVTAHDVPVDAEFVAQTQSSQAVNIQARVSGFLDKRVYTEGAVVKAGQVLFRMDPKPFQAQVDAAKAALQRNQAALAVAKANLDRTKPLTEQEALSQKDLDDAQGQYEQAAAAVEQAKAQLASANAEAARTQADYERQQALAGKELASRQTLEKAVAARDQSVAAVKSADAAIAGAEANVGVLQAQQREAAGTLAEPGSADRRASRQRAAHQTQSADRGRRSHRDRGGRMVRLPLRHRRALHDHDRRRLCAGKQHDARRQSDRLRRGPPRGRQHAGARRRGHRADR